MRDLANARGLDLRESARLLGYVNVATADTMIACWEAKYHYNFWRPNHAIQRADTDGNPGTFPEAGWLPLIVGNHPEYPSGHACVTGAVTESLRTYFGTNRVRLVVSSTATGAGAPRTYENLDELVIDVENARVWGGLHFRTTMTQTAEPSRASPARWRSISFRAQGGTSGDEENETRTRRRGPRSSAEER